MERKLVIKFAGLLVLFSVMAWLSLVFGGSQNYNTYIASEIRWPKTITAILAGASLSVSGLILQVIFRNPLAGPYVLGISSGASLMVALTLLTGISGSIAAGYFLGKTMVILSSITGSLLITVLILTLSKKISSNVLLLLFGLMLAQVCSAIEGALQYLANPDALKAFVIWGMGSLSGTTRQDLFLFAPLTVALLCIAFIFIKPLNAFLLGKDYALNAGIDYNKNRFLLILLSSLLTGIATAFCGPIAFVGIAVPLISRLYFRVSHQGVHLLSCMIIGATILLAGDVLCHALPGITLPINMITTLAGAPLVIVLLFKNKHW